MKISYCTTCHKRLWQIKQTIEHNLSFTKVDEVELCILTYNDKRAENYFNKNFKEYIDDGRLKVKNRVDKKEFSCGYVKNFSHEMGTGDILFNLDADNFIDNAHEILLNLKENEVVKNVVSKPDGRSGRIGVYKTLFEKVGGYRDVGRSDDGEFILRCVRSGAKLISMDCNLSPISNTKTITEGE